jgi:hypothetical protein
MQGLFINAWVKTPDEVAGLLRLLKDKVAECGHLYIEKIELSVRNADRANSMLMQDGGEQGRLNRVVAALDFSPDKTP